MYRWHGQRGNGNWPWNESEGLGLLEEQGEQRMSVVTLPFDHIFLKGLADGCLAMIQWVYEQHKFDLFLLFFFLSFGWCHKAVPMGLWRLGNECDQGVLCETPKWSIKILFWKKCTTNCIIYLKQSLLILVGPYFIWVQEIFNILYY